MIIPSTPQTATSSSAPAETDAAGQSNETSTFEQLRAAAAVDILDNATVGALNVIDEHALNVPGLDEGHLGLALNDEIENRRQHLVWVDLGGPAIGEWVAENFGGPFLHYLADTDWEFDEASRYDPHPVADELDVFGTPGLPAVARAIARLNDLFPVSIIVLADAWAARPYSRVRSRLRETAPAAIRGGAIAEVDRWQATDFGVFARHNPQAATLVTVNSEDGGWQYWKQNASTTVPQS